MKIYKESVNTIMLQAIWPGRLGRTFAPTGPARIDAIVGANAERVSQLLQGSARVLSPTFPVCLFGEPRGRPRGLDLRVFT